MPQHNNPWVEKILEFPWQCLDKTYLEHVMRLSYYTALEFADSLRLALRMRPDHEGLREMASGELNTTNLRFREYERSGDHSVFLRWFLDELDVSGEDDAVKQAADDYTWEVRRLPHHVQVMSVVSRENELPRLFERILSARGWRNQDLPRALWAYHYYLERHRELDSDEGGHADLISDIEVTTQVDVFWKLRYQLYYSALFRNIC